MVALRRLLFLICLLGIQISTCAVANEVPNSARRHSFQLIFLRQTWDELRLGYKADVAFAKLRSADWSKPLFVLGVDDIELYLWASQTIILKTAATDRLESDRTLSHGVFGVFVSGKPIYYGVVLDTLSQMGIDWPVLHQEKVNGHAVMHILPVQIPLGERHPSGAAMEEMTPAAKSKRERIRDPRVEEVMAKAKILVK